MELVIAAVVLAGGIVAGAVVFGRRTTVATVDGAPEAALGDGELRQREEQLARSSERSESLERSLDRRSDELERRARELDARAAELEASREELDRLRDEPTRALERAAGLSAGQAKQALLKDVEDQARHDSARIIRQVEE